MDSMDDGGMSDDDLINAIAQRTAQLIAPMFGDMKMSEFKDLLSGYTTKEAGQAAELATLKAQFMDLAAKIAAIQGDQPAVILQDQVLEALKSAGPQAPPDPGAPQLPPDASPIQRLAVQTMPALYSTNPQGQWNGWTPPAPLPPQS